MKQAKIHQSSGGNRIFLVFLLGLSKNSDFSKNTIKSVVYRNEPKFVFGDIIEPILYHPQIPVFEKGKNTS